MNGFKPELLDDLPEWLLVPKKQTKIKKVTRRKYSIEEVRTMLLFVKQDDRDMWRIVGIILGRYFNRSEAAWALYIEWADKWGGVKGRNHDGIMREAFYETSQDSNRGKELSIATIIKNAIEGGWTPPPPQLRKPNSEPLQNPFPVPTLGVTDSRDGTAETRPLTEHGNTLRFIDLYGGVVRYVYEVKAWFVWCDGAWHWDADGAYVRELLAKLPDLIYNEGRNAADMTQATHYAKWARISQQARTINAVLSILSDQSSIRLQLSMVDADPMLIGFDHACQVIDLRTGVARPAAPTDYISKSLSPSAIGDSTKAVRWLLFLEQIFNCNRGLIDFLHRYCGYLLTGMTSEHMFIFLFGLGANGKSVFAETIRHVMGDYARTVSSETLTETKRHAGGASPDLADLIGSRLAMSSETEDGRALAESLIKSLTSEDTITARKLYREPVQYKPTFKLVIVGNHKPMIHGTDHGIWRRVRLVPFNKTFSGNECDPHLLEKLKAEAPHILAWMVEGCLEWQRRPLSVDVPAAVVEQTAEYRQEQDVIGQWLNECTQADKAFEMAAGDLYTSYKEWALAAGLKPCSNISLGRRLAERGYEKRESNGKSLWLGLNLKF